MMWWASFDDGEDHWMKLFSVWGEEKGKRNSSSRVHMGSWQRCFGSQKLMEMSGICPLFIAEVNGIKSWGKMIVYVWFRVHLQCEESVILISSKLKQFLRFKAQNIFWNLLNMFSTKSRNKLAKNLNYFAFCKLTRSLWRMTFLIFGSMVLLAQEALWCN